MVFYLDRSAAGDAKNVTSRRCAELPDSATRSFFLMKRDFNPEWRQQINLQYLLLY